MGFEPQNWRQRHQGPPCVLNGLVVAALGNPAHSCERPQGPGESRPDPLVCLSEGGLRWSAGSRAGSGREPRPEEALADRCRAKPAGSPVCSEQIPSPFCSRPRSEPRPCPLPVPPGPEQSRVPFASPAWVFGASSSSSGHGTLLPGVGRGCPLVLRAASPLPFPLRCALGGPWLRRTPPPKHF